MGQPLPQHLGIIIDGNRRWAKARGKKPIDGHKEGYKTVREIARHSRDKGIMYLTIFAFSTENWQRPKIEVDALMQLVRYVFKNEIASLKEEGMKIKVIGSRKKVPKDIVRLIDRVEEETADNNHGTLVFCFNYGGHQEIADAASALAKKGTTDITPEDIARHLYQPDIPPVDFIIRTSGEQRLSNFMLWRAAYSELLFVDKHWPDFTEEDLDAALEDFANRQRRFGG